MPIPALVIAGIKLAPFVTSVIGKLIGAAPRGDLQKFQRTIYPYMAACAKQSGLPVYCFWFGDIVVVNPDSSYGVDIPQLNSISAADAILMERAETQQFYYADCARSDDDCVNHPSDIQFILYGNNSIADDTAPSQSAEAGYGISVDSSVNTPSNSVSQAGISGNNLTYIFIGGAILFLFMRKR